MKKQHLLVHKRLAVKFKTKTNENPLSTVHRDHDTKQTKNERNVRERLATKQKKNTLIPPLPQSIRRGVNETHTQRNKREMNKVRTRTTGRNTNNKNQPQTGDYN